jgi:hypothetical protein
MSPAPKYMHVYTDTVTVVVVRVIPVLASAQTGAARRGADSPSLWNINMTRNIISHDSRRHGNTKYYLAKSSDRLAVLCSCRPGGCVLPLAAARRTCTGHEKQGDKLTFARHDTAKSVRTYERASERFRSVSVATPGSSPTCAKRSFSAPVICASCDLSSELSFPEFSAQRPRTNPPRLLALGCSYRSVCLVACLSKLYVSSEFGTPLTCFTS